jgi:signal transduction histidine kinase
MPPDRPTPAIPPADAFMHELRTPLTVLLGRVQLLQRRHAGGRACETLEADLATLEAAVRQLVVAVEEAGARHLSER